MANDRVYLKCKACSGERLFFKYWGGHPVELWGSEIELMEFINDHLYCGAGLTMFLDGDPRFSLFTESEEPG